MKAFSKAELPGSVKRAPKAAHASACKQTTRDHETSLGESETNMNIELNTNELKTSKEAAKAVGETRYAGSPCSYEHDGVRYTSSGGCIECARISKEAHRLAQRGGRPAKQSRIPDEPVTLAWIKANCVENERGCWEWQKCRNEDGYGQVWYDRRMRGVHVVAFKLSGGEPQPDGIVMHSCDNPPCCNPAHLSAGTQLQNIEDMKVKGRARGLRGEAHPNSVTTTEMVIRIREMLPYRTTASIAAELGIERSTVSNIKRGVTWSHLPLDPSVPVAPVKPRQPVEQVAQIKAQLAAGKSGAAIAKEFGVSAETVSSIKLGKQWANVKPATDREAA